jgi:vanillate O-demethylase monooxygenase subunit
VVKAHEQRKTSEMASRSTPLLRNHWYVAALSEEVSRKPIRRTILERDIVLYRGEAGEVIALHNRCAHRSYPLHLGELNGDRIVCGYHGFEYGPDGRCAHVPALGAERPGIRVAAFPVKEIGPFIWIWTGDPDAVDYGKLVEQPWFTEPGWRPVHGYMHVAGNYLGLHENLMDLSHFPFLHTFAKGQTALATLRPERTILKDRVTSRLVMPNFPVSPLAMQVLAFQAPVTEDSLTLGQTPCMFWAEVSWIDSSSPPKTMTRYIIHCMTPESQTSTHYYWAISRNGGLDSLGLDEEMAQVGHGAFHEDKVALEEIERLLARENFPDFREALIPSDAGGVQVLRLIARWAAEEAREVAQAELDQDPF